MSNDFINCFLDSKYILMEGAIAERLKREFNLKIDGDVALASFIYSDREKLEMMYKNILMWRQNLIYL